MGSLEAGVVKVNITPPVGIPMAGFAAREHGSVAVHDELWTRVFYLSDGGEEVVIAGNDILTFSNETADRIQKSTEELTGIPADNILLNCTHTHSGPAYRTGEDEVVDRYLSYLMDTIVGAIDWAKRSSRPAAIGWTKEPVQCGVNRREQRGNAIVLGYNPEGPVVPWVDILKVSAEDGELMGVLFCHPVHAVVLGSNNYQISGDLAGAAERFVERNTGVVAAFLQGCCGNINSDPSCSTTGNMATFDDAERLGTRLGAAVIKGLTGLDTEKRELSVHAGKRSFHLPVEKPPGKERARSELESAEQKLEEVKSTGGGASELRRAKTAYHRAEERLSVAREGLDRPGLPMSVWAVSLGRWTAVGLPAEVFVELGEEIRTRSPFGVTVVLGYTNGSWMYLPTREAFSEGGYEVRTRGSYRGLCITESAGEVMVSETLKLLNTL